MSEGGRGKRYSYKLPQEYNIETVVVADPAMVSYHGTDAARRFILTTLNMVGNLKLILMFCQQFMHSRLISLLLLMILTEHLQGTVSTRPSAGCQDLVRMFCSRKPWCCRLICTSGHTSQGSLEVREQDDFLVRSPWCCWKGWDIGWSPVTYACWEDTAFSFHGIFLFQEEDFGINGGGKKRKSDGLGQLHSFPALSEAIVHSFGA